MIGYVALAITAIIIVSVCARIDNWHRDWSSNFAETDVSAKDPELRPLTLDRSPENIANRIRQWAETQPDWQVVAEESGSESTKLHLTRTTRVFRFVDDIHVTITGEGQVSTVNATSQSRVGKGDLGQNPRNLKQLLGSIATAS